MNSDTLARIGQEARYGRAALANGELSADESLRLFDAIAKLAEGTPTATVEHLGVKVALTHRFIGAVTLRNVTEIHHGYNAGEIARLPAKIEATSVLRKPKIAFESDIHATGITYELADVIEYETTLETERAEVF